MMDRIRMRPMSARPGTRSTMSTKWKLVKPSSRGRRSSKGAQQAFPRHGRARPGLTPPSILPRKMLAPGIDGYAGQARVWQPPFTRRPCAVIGSCGLMAPMTPDATNADHVTTVLRQAGVLGEGCVRTVDLEDPRDTILSHIVRLKLT